VKLSNGSSEIFPHLTVHILRDLSAWVPQQGEEWPQEKCDLMLRFCSSLFIDRPHEIFLIAANDGQLTESLRRLPSSPEVQRARAVVEELLVSDRERLDGCYLSLFNLSRGSSADLFERALNAFLTHEGWDRCRAEASAPDQLFGDECPIRRNYELLGTDVVRSRLKALLELCDQNGLHVPVRQILLLLSNSILGHPAAKDHLMMAEDVPRIVAEGNRHHASIYNNLFGGNLTENRRSRALVFEYLERFQIGHETSNRIDNLLIFGESREDLAKQFFALIESDAFYGANASYSSARRRYIEGADETSEAVDEFLNLLVSQRRALFFKVPDDQVRDLPVWDLTVFRYGGEYLDEVLEVLRKGRFVRRNIIARLVRGTNRIFTGMLINSDHELFLASGASLSQAKVSRFIDERVSVSPKHGGEKVEIIWDAGHPYLNVCLGGASSARFQLTLTRYEYLSRVADGAMPNSFSKECFEDVMAFKSRLMRELETRDWGPKNESEIVFRVLEIDAQGTATEQRVGVLHE
jgi:hypothetical protein